MAFTDKEKGPVRGKEQKSPGADRLSDDIPAFGLPNSVMADLLADGDDGYSNGVPTIQRQISMPHRQIPSAEAEADRLSAGVRGTTPDSIRREMGNRLNADLSSVRFHSDPFSRSQASRMGARAWTSGRDVYFGQGGFEPRIAAHELVHTVQQGAARGSVRQSVTPGTVQMWWPFSRKKSKFDKDVEPSDIADSLFRIQAGFSASDEREQSERDAMYAKTYDSELKRINKANRNRIDDENYDPQSLARNAAARSAANLRVKRKDYVSKDDKASYNSKIRSINKDTYKELLDRRNEAAEELVDFFHGINERNTESVDKNKYTAAFSTSGRNYKLYSQLIQKIETAHANDPVFQGWKNEYQAENRKGIRTLEQANTILNDGSSDNNTYLKTGEGIHQRVTATHGNKSFYKQVYAKKKTKLDRMAAAYRRNKVLGPKNNTIKIDRLDEIDLDEDQPDLNNPDKSRNNIISAGEIKKDDDDFILEGMQNNNINIANNGEKKPENIIPASLKEDHDNIITNSIKEEEEDDSSSGSNGALKQKVMEFISTSSQPKGMSENEEPDLIDQDEFDPDLIPRRSSVFTENLTNIDQYVPASPTVNKVKDKKGKTDLVKNIVKTEAGLVPLGISAVNRNKLNGNIYKNYINPAFSGAGGAIGGVTGLLGTVTGAADTIRNIKNVKSGGSHWDWVNSGTDTIGSAANMAAGGLTTMQSAGGIPLVGQTLANLGSFGGQAMVPGLNIATGGASLITGAIEGIRGQSSINTIDDQIEALQQTNMQGKKQKEDQLKLLKIFRQGRRVSELHRTGGAMKAVGGAIALGTGIALLTGPLAPITAAVLGIGGAAAGITQFIYGHQKKKELRRIVTAEEMGINWEREKDRVRRQFRGEKLSNDEIKEIIIKSHGINAKTRKQAFQLINMDRAKMLLDIATGKGPLRALAEKVIGALGISRKKGRYAAGAQKLIAEKLGG
ncbi:MAG: DUF4157 domain-containing protein [Flexilinea sp.]|nr:DUF4157 domain-containing protein [Flexilinea sp.]